MEYKIIRKKMPPKVLGCVIASTFVFTLNNSIKAKDIKEGQKKYNYYVGQYFAALNEENYEFDENFVDIYQNGQYIIENNEYDIKTIYIVKLENGEKHLIKAGENKTDLITKKQFEGKKIKIACFKDTSLFYELYNLGIIKDKNIILENIAKYVNYWDGEKHKEARELRADAKAQEEYNKKFGKKN